MVVDTNARFPLSQHIFRTHYSGGGTYSQETGTGYTPEMLKRAYCVNGAYTGKGVKIAIVAAFDNLALQENMQMFCQEFNLPDVRISVHYPDGRNENAVREWIVESSLDTQWAHAFAPDAEIYTVFSQNAEVKTLLSAAEYAADELRADVVCMSFGTEESSQDASLAEFMCKKKCIFTSSSGDVGGKVSFPSTSPCCISVGGTNLVVGTSGQRVSETAWRGGGGGASDVFEIAPYQGRFFDIYGMTDGKRATPDVALCAGFEPGAAVYTSQLGGWTTVGGTSFSNACFAGICACIRERYPEITTSVDVLSFLYGKAGTTGYEMPQYNFNDIVLGKSGSFYAERGWDFATGLGSPVLCRLLL